MKVPIHMPKPHEAQLPIKGSDARRVVVCAGRRGGKTTLATEVAIERMLEGRRVLLASATQEQADAFWDKAKAWLDGAFEAGVMKKNESRRIITSDVTGGRIRAKTAWNADTLRGDHADFLVMDEAALMDEEAWEDVAQPMLMDNDGDAWLISTPPAADPEKHWFTRKFRRGESGDSEWASFRFTSEDNPHISADAGARLGRDMTQASYRREILAQFVAPEGALWKWEHIEREEAPATLDRVVIGVDPAGGGPDEIGIVAVGKAGERGYVLEDASMKGSPNAWAAAAAACYRRHSGDRVVAERNFGGDMVEATLRTADANLPVEVINASRGKQQRAEPVAALYEQGRVAHAGTFDELEAQLTGWDPNESNVSPDRCLVAGTMVQTWSGEKAIEEVSPGDMVLTRQGYKPVLAAGRTGEQAKVVEARLSTGRTLAGTPNHPVFAKGVGFKELGTLAEGEALYAQNECIHNKHRKKSWQTLLSRLRSEARRTRDTPMRSSDPTEFITALRRAGRKTWKRFTAKCGSIITAARCQRDTSSTTRTKTRSTTTLKILSALLGANMPSGMKATSTGMGWRSILMRFVHWLQSGTRAKKGEGGIQNMPNVSGKTESRKRFGVRSAAKSIRQKLGMKTSDSVRVNALTGTTANQVDGKRSGSARCAVKPLKPASTGMRDTAQKNARQLPAKNRQSGSPASSAKKSLKRPPTPQTPVSAQKSAGASTTTNKEGTKSNGNAPSAETPTQRTNISPPSTAPVRVQWLHETGRADVYNLRVAEANEYFANGVLVHNCDALVFALTELMLGRGETVWKV